MSVNFVIEKTRYGSPDERFIKLKGAPHKVSSSNPDINCSSNPSKNDTYFEDSFRPISVQVGSNQYWYFDTAWGLFELPNHKVSEIIEQKLINKYGKNTLIIHKYECENNGKNMSFLLVIRNTTLISVYTTIILANKISRDFINTDKLYIGVINDINVKHNIITDCGRTNHYYLFPEKYKEVSELYDLKNQEDIFKMQSAHYNVENINGIESADYQLKDGIDYSTITLDTEYSNKFGDIINGKLENITRDDIEFFIKMRKTLLSSSLDISLTSKNEKGVLITHSVKDIIQKIKNAESIILKLG